MSARIACPYVVRWVTRHGKIITQYYQFEFQALIRLDYLKERQFETLPMEVRK